MSYNLSYGTYSSVSLRVFLHDNRAYVDDVFIIIAIMIGLMFVWEFLVDVFLHVFRTQPHVIALQEILFRQLTIVGLVSILLFLFGRKLEQASSGIGSQIWRASHLAVFAFALFFVGVFLLISIMTVVIFKRWGKLERNIKRRDKVFSDAETLETRYKNMNSLAKIFNFPFRWKLSSAREKSDYLAMRDHFIQNFQLPADFKFNVYLKRCLKNSLNELGQIHWTVLLIILMLILGTWIPFSHRTTNKMLQVPMVILTAVLTIFGLILLAKIYYIHYHLRMNKNNKFWDSRKTNLKEIRDLKDALIRQRHHKGLNQYNTVDDEFNTYLDLRVLEQLCEHENPCACLTANRDNQFKEFWFSSPTFFMYLFQMFLFFLSLWVAFTLAIWAGAIHVYRPYALIPTFFCAFLIMYVTRWIMYHWSICMNVGEFSKFDIMLKVDLKYSNCTYRYWLVNAEDGGGSPSESDSSS